MPSIFISYRREDSDYVAHAIERELSERFGKDSVFIDVDTLRLGEDFREQIRAAVARCDVLLALIGDGWLDAADEHGRRRLDDPGDWVRVEIEAALDRGVPVIPVLVGRAERPAVEALPESLRGLPYLEDAEVRAGRDFDHHVDRLARGIARLGTSPGSPTAAATRADASSRSRGISKIRSSLQAPVFGLLLTLVLGLGVVVAAVVVVSVATKLLAMLIVGLLPDGLALRIESDGHVQVTEEGRVSVNASEGDAVRLRAVPIGVDDEESVEIVWTQTGGRDLGPLPAGAALALEAPNAAEDYTLEFDVTAAAPPRRASLRVAVGVRARDEPPALTVDAPARVAAGDPVTLSAQASDPEGGAVTFAWSQVRGPPVELAGADAPRATFVAPAIERDQELGFRAEARDAAGNAASDGVVVAVAARPGPVPSVARLAIERVAPARATTCDVLAIRYVVRNAGRGPVPAGVVVREKLPRGLTASGQSEVAFTVPEAIAPGASYEHVVACRIRDTGTYASRATATLDGVAVASEQTTTIVGLARLKVRLECPDHEMRGARDDEVVAVIENVGDLPARNVVVDMKRPEYGEGGGTWQTDAIAPGEEVRSAAFRVWTTVNQALDVYVTVTGDCTETTTAHCDF